MKGVVELTHGLKGGDCIPHKQHALVKSYQVSSTTCTLLALAPDVVEYPRRIVCLDVAYGNDMDRSEKENELTSNCPRNEIKKLETELWNLKGNLNNTHQAQQQLPRRQECGPSYAAVTGERKEYAGDSTSCATIASFTTMAVHIKMLKTQEVMEKVGSVAYKLEFPQELSRVHHTFHVSNLKKCYADEPLAVPLDGLHIDDKLHFVEEPVEIMDREVK
ncbi:hypothetical protein Tco_0414094 [Tanacetum coccineum]